jgi:anti-sigma regulatory factor (Ser/Thr protein kinase)
VTTITRALAPGVDAATRARRALDELEASVPEPVMRDLELLVSEVVTNAVRHAGASRGDLIGLSVEVGRDRVRVEVADPGPGFEPAPAVPTMFQESGWGLYLVGQLSDRWGVEVERDPQGTVVWFEIDLTRV